MAAVETVWVTPQRLCTLPSPKGQHLQTWTEWELPTVCPAVSSSQCPADNAAYAQRVNPQTQPRHGTYNNVRYANTIKPFVWQPQTKLICVLYNGMRMAAVLIVQLFLLSQEEGQLPLWLVYISWRQTRRSQHRLVQHQRAAGIQWKVAPV